MSNRMQSVAAMIFSLAFIAVLALINSNVIGIGRTVNRQLGNAHQTMQESELRDYDSTTVTGATVINAIRNRDRLYEYELKVTVTTRAGNTTTYDALTNYDKGTPISSSKYINPVKSFSAAIQYDAGGNDVITGLTFVEK